MQFRFCPQCGGRLTQKKIGDEGEVPFCGDCNRPWFGFSYPCVICLLTDGAGKYALIRQTYATRNYVCVAGFIHEGETAEQTAVREVREETGLVCADEMLYPENYRYLSDILSYVAVGARSVEDQEHRLTASGMECPCGMKNPTSGTLSIMLNSIRAAQSSHTFIYRGWEVNTDGNPLAHAILRGAQNKHDQTIPNYHYEDLKLLYDMYQEKNLRNMACIVDTNHSNSGKKYMEQIRIANEILHSMRHSPEIRSMVKGLMIESYIEDGAQKVGDGVYGKSITDPCLGWEKSEKLVLEIADQL